MEEAHQIVLQALEQAGVAIPAGVDSVQDLSSSALVSMCRGALARIEDVSFAAPPPFPVSMAERFRVCRDVADSIKHLGFKGDLSFHQFFYPSKEESYKVLSFLLDKLSKTSSDGSGGRKGYSSRFANESIRNSKTFNVAEKAPSNWFEGAKQNTDSVVAGGLQSLDARNVPFSTHPLRLASIKAAQGQKTPPPITMQAKPKSVLIPSVLEGSVKNASISTALLHGQLSYLSLEVRHTETEEIGDARIMGKSLLQVPNISSYLDVETNNLSQEGMSSKKKDFATFRERINHRESIGKAQFEELASSFSDGQIKFQQIELRTLQERLHIISTDNSKLTQENRELKEGIDKLEVDFKASSKHLEGLKEKHSLIKIAVEIALDSTQSEESKLLHSKKDIEESQQRLTDSKIHWESVYTNLESKKSQLELSALTEDEELRAKLQELKNVHQQIQDTTIKLKERKEQLDGLTAELEKGTKGPLRSAYVERITELIKNSKKQDNDISRIIGDTRELQRESNANQGRLKRTYALVDELIFRDAKKDPIFRQAYRLLTSIHQDFLIVMTQCFQLIKSVERLLNYKLH